MRYLLIMALALAFAAPALAKGKPAFSNISSYWCDGHPKSPLCKH